MIAVAQENDKTEFNNTITHDVKSPKQMGNISEMDISAQNNRTHPMNRNAHVDNNCS